MWPPTMRLLRIALAPVGQFFAFADALDPLDDALDDFFGDSARARRRVRRHQGLDRLLGLVVIVLDQLAVQGLREFRAVAIERIGFEAKPPRQHIGVPCNPRSVASFGMLIVFEIAPEMKGCAAAIMRIWLSTER